MPEHARGVAVAIILLMVTSTLTAFLSFDSRIAGEDFDETRIQLDDSSSESLRGSAKGTTSLFADGNSSSELDADGSDMTALTNRPGQRISAAALNLTAGGLLDWTNDSHSMMSLAPNSTGSMTTVDALGDLRLNTTYGGNVPNAGTNNTQVHLNSMWQGGNYSFDTFRIVCTGMSCGSITVQGGPLRIYANTIIIDQGAGIYADEMVWVNTGQGSSTQRGSNGKSPGAGGAGHGATGGTGGGTNGGAGGVNYGNASEPGSSGGNVTFTNANGQTSVDAQGGRGGGQIELVARTIWMNGTISANGGRGDDGAPPSSGTGPGGSGAGGGSGGSVVMMANFVNIGNTGTVRAVGEDGGDGADGVQNGPGIGMYDGGHGGGGGAGGIVMVVSTPNNLNNNGAMHANGGNGGSGGQPYGTGTAGSSGYNGGNGYAFTGSFAGWGGAATYALSGNYTSPVFGQAGQVYVDGSSEVDFTMPANTSINASFHYSVDGTTWSDWQPFNISHQSLPPFSLVQFHFDLATNDNSTTPRVHRINLSASSWHSIDDLTFSISNSSTQNEFWKSGSNLGVVRNVTAIASMGPTTIRAYLPTNAEPKGSAWFHIIPPVFNIQSDVEISIGGTTLLALNSSDFPAMGLTVEVNLTTLQSNWPTTPHTTNGSAGLAWGDLSVTCSASGPFMGSFTSSFSIIPYQLTHRIGENGTLISSINDFVNQTSGRWAEATFSQIPLRAQGVGFANHTVILDNLSVTYVDDILPEALNISFYVNDQWVSEARVGELVEVRVKLLGNESDATIQWHMEGLGGISSWPPTTLSTMAWDTLHNGYIGFFDTSQFSAEYGDSMALWMWMEDAAGNQRNPGGVAAWYEVLILKPVLPDFSSIQVAGCETVVVSVCEVEAGTELVFQVSANEGRGDLDVFAHLTSSSGERERVIQLFWHDTSKVYDGSLIFSPDEGEWWDLIFRVMDVNRNEDNWSTGPVTMIQLVDRTEPVEGVLTVSESSTTSLTWSIYGEWQQSAVDGGNVTLSISGPDGYALSEVLTPMVVSDMGEATSYVALGGPEVMGVGATSANNTTTALVHQHLDDIWPGVAVTNLSDSWGSVMNFISSRDDIIAANPDIVTILPLRDYSSSSSSVWQTNYPILLDDLGAMGVDVYLGHLQLDPDYTCHIGSGAAGCHSFGEYEMISEKNRIINEIVSTRPWVTLVPLSDDAPEHPEWRNGDGSLSDEGHRITAAAFTRAIDGIIGQRQLNMAGSHLLDLTPLSPGVYEFEMVVEDGSGNIALDAKSGADAANFLSPDENILSLSVVDLMASAPIYPGEIEVLYNATCLLDCSMLLDVYLNGEFVNQLTPTGGEESFMLAVPDIGDHSVSLRLTTPDWNVNEVNVSTDLTIIPTPKPVWDVSCASYDEEVVLTDFAKDGKIGTIWISTHFIECVVSNSGNADGDVIISPSSLITPFECSSEPTLIVQGSEEELHCTVEESDAISGFHSISLLFEEITTEGNTSIGGYQADVILLTPRFTADEVPNTDEPSPSEGDQVEVAGSSPLKWILSAFFLLVIGIGGITLLFMLRERREPHLESAHEESLFIVEKRADNVGDLGTLHPALSQSSDGDVVAPTPPAQTVPEMQDLSLAAASLATQGMSLTGTDEEKTTLLTPEVHEENPSPTPLISEDSSNSEEDGGWGVEW